MIINTPVIIKDIGDGGKLILQYPKAGEKYRKYWKYTPYINSLGVIFVSILLVRSSIEDGHSWHNIALGVCLFAFLWFVFYHYIVSNTHDLEVWPESVRFINPYNGKSLCFQAGDLEYIFITIYSNRKDGEIYAIKFRESSSHLFKKSTVISKMMKPHLDVGEFYHWLKEHCPVLINKTTVRHKRCIFFL